ncbi:hypothetical protein [Myxococcus sp. Y35]|uniref:hypothetical protein n=1 Tax=Pseudomyxococcus flavus TaxID=3115648 RepID=UPI003CF08E1E
MACVDDSGCPSSCHCVTVPAGHRMCEVLFPPRPSASLDGGSDAGSASPDDGGVVPARCKDVQPGMAASCVSNCHGAESYNSGHASFRLDSYVAEDGGVPGAKSQALHILARAVNTTTMPPSCYNPKPTAEARALLGRWSEAGASYCDTDGGTDARRETPLSSRHHEETPRERIHFCLWGPGLYARHHRLHRQDVRSRQ